MILQRLVEHYDRLADAPDSAIAPFGFSREKISFALVINDAGEYPELTDIRTVEGKKLLPKMMVVPDRGGRQGTGLKPNFLWDNSGYVLGLDSKGNVERSQQAFEAFRDFHEELAKRIKNDELDAVARFLSRWSIDRASSFSLLADALDKNIVFRVRGRTHFVHETPAIQNAWTTFLNESSAEVTSGQNLISGNVAPIARLHPLISGVTGAQAMGAAIASFNSNAYESYGRSQTFNAPVSVADAFKYTASLNGLLEGRSRRIQLGDTTVVFWSAKPTQLEEFVSEIWSEGPPPGEDASPEDRRRAEEVRLFLSQLRLGHAGAQALSPENSTGFYVLGLSPNASRLSIRFWIDSTVGEMKDRLAQHMEDINLAGAREGDPPLIIRRIVLATGRAETDQKGRLKGYDLDSVPPLLAGAIARAVLTGGVYPQLLLAAMLNRLRADGVISHPRVAAIKGCLVRNSRLHGKRKEVPVSLDTNRTEPSYVTGRLFALLEKIQSDSLGGDLNATIKDRYFSAASATPGVVFPRLIRLSQHHLAKMETGQKIYYEKQLGEVINKLDCFANHLSLEEQGLFAVGYFHQRQVLFTSRKTKDEGATK